MPAEVTEFDQVRAVAEHAVRRYGKLDTWVHLAEDAPDNLFGPVEGLDTIEGSFGHRAHPRSLYNWLELHPKAKRGAALGAALGTLVLLRGRS